MTTTRRSFLQSLSSIFVASYVGQALGEAGIIPPLEVPSAPAVLPVTTIPSDGLWHHIVVTRSAGKVTLFTDALEVSDISNVEVATADKQLVISCDGTTLLDLPPGTDLSSGDFTIDFRLMKHIPVASDSAMDKCHYVSDLRVCALGDLE